MPLAEAGPKEKQKTQRDEISHDMERYLSTIANNPFHMLTEYDRMIEEHDNSHNRTKGNALRRSSG